MNLKQLCEETTIKRSSEHEIYTSSVVVRPVKINVGLSFDRTSSLDTTSCSADRALQMARLSGLRKSDLKRHWDYFPILVLPMNANTSSSSAQRPVAGVTKSCYNVAKTAFFLCNKQKLDYRGAQKTAKRINAPEKRNIPPCCNWWKSFSKIFTLEDLLVDLMMEEHNFATWVSFQNSNCKLSLLV